MYHIYVPLSVISLIVHFCIQQLLIENLLCARHMQTLSKYPYLKKKHSLRIDSALFSFQM